MTFIPQLSSDQAVILKLIKPSEMSSRQNTPSSNQSEAEENRKYEEKKEKNRIAVRKHREAQNKVEEERKAAIQYYKEDNMKLENDIRALRAEGEFFRRIVEAHELASGGQFSRTPEGAQIIENISQFFTGPAQREQERREEGR